MSEWPFKRSPKRVQATRVMEVKGYKKGNESDE